MKRCSKCAIDYPDSDSFCMQCGSGLEGIVKKPGPEAGPEIRKMPGTKIPHLGRRLRALEEGMGGLGREILDMKAAAPEDLELLRSAVGGTTGRIAGIDSRVKALSGRLEESERHIKGIEDLVANLVRRKDLEAIESGITARFAARAVKDNERFGGMEAEIKNELGRLNSEFTKDLKGRLDSAAKRVERLEANLESLVNGLERMVAKRLEDFKTGFNQRVNKSILELGGDVAEKTSIISRLRENLEGQIRLNEERYSQFEGRLKKELEDIDSFKEGLTVQQDSMMKKFRTELLERLGEVKKLEEDLALHQQKKMLLMEEKLRQGLEGMRQAGQAPASGEAAGPDAGGVLKLKREVENAIKGIKRLEEDLIIQQEGRLMALESRIGGTLGGPPGEGTNIKQKGKI